MTDQEFEELISGMEEELAIAEKARAEYLARGVCEMCGACNQEEAGKRCHGKLFGDCCLGEGLWQ